MKLDSKEVARLARLTALPDGKTDVIYFDDNLPGFGLRLRATGGRIRRTWVAQYRHGGRSRRMRLGTFEKIKPEQARAAAREVLAKVELGHDPQGEKTEARARQAHTLRAVIDEYLAAKQTTVRASTFRAMQNYLIGPYFAPLHNMVITDIGLRDVATRLTAITRQKSSVTASRARTALSGLFTWSMRQGLLGEKPSNPIIGTAAPPDSKPRDRVLSDAELAAIWRATGDNEFGKVVRLLTLTACRRDEIGGLRWSEVNLDKGVITLPAERTKNAHPHTLPLSPMVLQIVGTVHQRVGRDHLFGERGPRGFSKWNHDKAALDARLGGKAGQWRLHDLRRSAATWMAEHDIEPHIIEAILNHQGGHKRGVAGVYNRAKYLRQMQVALSIWADHVRTIVDGGERKVVTFRGAV